MSNSIWVCGACGKTASNKNDFKDVSCVLHATECDAETLKHDDKGYVVEATAIHGEDYKDE